MNFLTKLYNSRTVLFDMLSVRGIDVSNYRNFSMKEIDIMFKNNTSKIDTELNPLDLKIENENGNVFVKYILSGKVRISNIQQLINEMSENVLQDNDTFIIITREKLSNEASIESLIESIYKKNNINIQVFWIDTIVINITHHELVPQHRVINQSEKESLLEKYNIKTYNQLPIILKNDPVAKFYGMKRGDVCEIKRPSETAGEYVSYRFCQ